MSKLGSWKFVVVLLSLVLLFSGCGGGGGNSTSSNPSPTPAPNTTPTPNAQEQNTTPDIGTNTETYTDTYDMEKVINGQWTGLNGSGTAIGSDGTYTLLLSSSNISVFNTQIADRTGFIYITHRTYWGVYSPEGYYLGKFLLYCDAEKSDLVHAGSNVWQYNGTDDKFTATFLSETLVMIEQEVNVTVDNIDYRCSLKYTIGKRSSVWY